MAKRHSSNFHNSCGQSETTFPCDVNNIVTHDLRVKKTKKKFFS